MRAHERNIVLTGFKGTGKTAVGRQLAERLGYAFLDLDAALEEESGLPIPQLFTERGEAGFRELEARMVERAALRKRCVIATGGGTVVDPDNLRALKHSGVVVALTANLETILARLATEADRPVLRGRDLRERVEQLLAERRDAYAQADATVDTTGRTIEETVDCVLHAVKAGPFRAPKAPGLGERRAKETRTMARPSGRTPSKYAFLLGEHISHSLSPAIHNPAYAALGLDYEFGLMDVPPSRLQEALARMRQPDCLGGNITMPYKRDVLAAADECSETVRRCEAASLMMNRNGRFVLHNNDVEAIAACLGRRAAAVAKGPAVIIGAGGSAAAMLEALRRVPPTRVVVLARRPDAAKALVERARGWLSVPVEAGDLAEGGKKMAGAAVIFNATSLGVHAGDPSPVPADVLRPGLLVYDIVYQREGLNALQTEALAAGALVCDGMMHIFEQAPFSFQMLTDREAPRALMLESLLAATGRKPLDWGADAVA